MAGRGREEYGGEREVFGVWRNARRLHTAGYVHRSFLPELRARWLLLSIFHPARNGSPSCSPAMLALALGQSHGLQIPLPEWSAIFRRKIPLALPAALRPFAWPAAGMKQLCYLCLRQPGSVLLQGNLQLHGSVGRLEYLYLIVGSHISVLYVITAALLS